MNKLLYLQLAYLAFAIGYNVVSFILLQRTGVGLAAMSPVFGFAMVAAIVGPCTVIGFLGYMKTHAIYTLFVSVVFCLVGGRLPHIRAYLSEDLSSYKSLGSLIAAAGINATGSVIFLLSAINAWGFGQDIE